MITIENNSTILQFGTGDICVNSLACEDDNECSVGFKNQSAREIGSEGDIKVNQPCNLEDFDVIMRFTKVESVDVVIRALEDAKRIILEKQ